MIGKIAIIVVVVSVLGQVEASAHVAEGSSSVQQGPERRLQQADDGGCNYGAWKAGRCPGQAGGYHIFYWDVLFAQPFGVPPAPCKRKGQACTADSDCCRGSSLSCVSGTCQASGCFAGDTRVVIKESATPVRIRDLQTGQHVQCVNSGADLTSPGEVTFCPVMTWMHASKKAVQTRQISFTRHNGEPGNVTLTFNHYMMRLTTPGVAVGATAARLDAFGAFETVEAAMVDLGDKIVLLQDPADASAGYYVTEVTGLQTVNADGIYFPMIEMPYIIADGAVVPTTIDFNMPLLAPPSVYGPANVLIQYLGSPAWMKGLQPQGVPGINGSWPDPAGANQTWPIYPPLVPFNRLIRAKVSQGLAVDFSAARDWFMQRYTAWKANSSQVVSWEEMMQAFDQMWVPQPAAGAGSSIAWPLGIEGPADSCGAVAVASPLYTLAQYSS